VPTIGVDFAVRVLDIMGERIKMQVWDTAGIKKFQVISSCYIKGCQAAIIVFDVTNPQSYK
jgi:GTPase SAR1 family protein